MLDPWQPVCPDDGTPLKQETVQMWGDYRLTNYPILRCPKCGKGFYVQTTSNAVYKVKSKGVERQR